MQAPKSAYFLIFSEKGRNLMKFTSIRWNSSILVKSHDDLVISAPGWNIAPSQWFISRFGGPRA